MDVRQETVLLEKGELFDLKVTTYYYDEYSPTTVVSAYTKDGYYIGNKKDATYLMKTKGLSQLQPAKSGNTVCSIGFCEAEQKWYGWSHRAINGYGVGSKVSQGDCAFQPSNVVEWLQDKIAWHLGVLDRTRRLTFDAVTNELYIEWNTLSSVEKYDPAGAGKGEWIAATIDDAKRMAQDFAESVSSVTCGVSVSSAELPSNLAFVSKRPKITIKV